MVESISTLGIQHQTSNNLVSGQLLLSKLSEQLTTGIYSSNLSEYASASAQKLLNFNGKVNEQNGFLSVIGTIAPRISAYDTALTGIESVAGDAVSAVLSSSVYNEETNASLQGTIEGYMDSMSYYLDQKIGDRYIFSGTRYDQAPVISGAELAALPTPPTETAPYLATSPAVPAYDSNYNPTVAAVAATGNIPTGMDFTAKTPGAGSNDIQITITSDTSGVPTTYGVHIVDPSVPTTEDFAGFDAATFWADLDTAINDPVTGSTLVSGTVNGGTADITTLVGNNYGLSGGIDATSVNDPYPEAYVKDSVRIDTTKDLTYGVTSNETGFQQIIMGLRFAYSATKDPTNYSTLMETAQTLLSQGLANVRGTHTDVTNANSTLGATKTTISTNINNLKDQVDNIENVDINEVGVKVTVLQAQLEATYAVTAKMASLSILKYL